MLFLVIVATLLGTALSTWALHHLIAPVRLSRIAMTNYERARVRPSLPDSYSDDAGQLMGSVSRALAKLERERNELLNLAREDWLTGLPNRRAAEEYLGACITNLQHANSAFCIAMIDINQFKAINDQHGHAFGDTVLRLVAKQFVMNLRNSDWVCRWAGDEFMVGVSSNYQETFDRISQMTLPLCVDGTTITFAFGVSEVAEGKPVSEIVEQADAAMYEKKVRQPEITLSGLDSLRETNEPYEVDISLFSKSSDRAAAKLAVETTK